MAGNNGTPNTLRLEQIGALTVYANELSWARAAIARRLLAAGYPADEVAAILAEGASA